MCISHCCNWISSILKTFPGCWVSSHWETQHMHFFIKGPVIIYVGVGGGGKNVGKIKISVSPPPPADHVNSK